MDEISRRRASDIGYKITDFSAMKLNFASDTANTTIINAIKKSKASNIVFAGIAPTNMQLYRKELPNQNIIFHLHTMPIWEPIVRMEAGRRVAKDSDSKAKIIQWCIFKYLREKFFHTFRRRYVALWKTIYDSVDSIILLTNSYAEQLQHILKRHATKAVVIYNPFDPSNLRLLSETQKKNEVVYIGRLQCIEKGVDNLLIAWKLIANSHPDWKLKIVGDGPDAEYLRKMVSLQNIPNVEFCGYSANVGRHLSTASILCLPSNVEGWPTVLIEAMAAGVIPIAFGCSSGVCEILSDNRGIIVQQGNVKQFAKQLANLISHPENRQTYSQRYTDYVNSFPVDAAVNTYLKLLNYEHHA